MNCPHCGAQNGDGTLRCTSCGFELQAVPAPVSGVERIIPYKNVPGLIAYYLGIFSLLGGFVLGVPALILGIMGLKHANLHPEARGKAHAWTGILLGGLMTLVSLALVGLMIAGAMQH